jgi:hypothetical protein
MGNMALAPVAVSFLHCAIERRSQRRARESVMKTCREPSHGASGGER